MKLIAKYIDLTVERHAFEAAKKCWNGYRYVCSFQDIGVFYPNLGCSITTFITLQRVQFQSAMINILAYCTLWPQMLLNSDMICDAHYHVLPIAKYYIRISPDSPADICYDRPFLVAPFVAMGVKVLLPWLAERLHFWNRTLTCHGICRMPLGILTNILSLIFVYDCDAVGGPRFHILAIPD